MITTTSDFVKKWINEHQDIRGDVLEVGSLDVNGNIRHLFKEFKSYTGSDMREGSNVDVVVDGHNLLEVFKPSSFDLVVCIDTLEHDCKFWETVNNMRQIVKPGGYLIICVPSLRHPRHNHPSDYYRFFETSFVDVFFDGFEDVITRVDCYSDNNSNSPDEILGWGRRPK